MKVVNNYIFFSSLDWPAIFFPTLITINSQRYHSVGQYLMAEKARLFKDKKALEKILQTNDAYHLISIGRKINNYSKEIWKDKCDQIIYRGSREKFYASRCQQQIKGKQFILASYNRYWGIGLAENDSSLLNEEKWNGQNRLGTILNSAIK